MSLSDIPTLILTQVPSRTQLADTRALMQRVQAAAEQAWEREITLKALLPLLEATEEFGLPEPGDEEGDGVWG